MKPGRAPKIEDPRQLVLFGDDLERDDPLLVFYRRLRKTGAWLTLDHNTGQIFAGRLNGGLSDWAVKTIAPFRDRILGDLLRVEYGVTEPEAPEALDGGAVLHRLPGRRAPELDPPVRPGSATTTRRDPGAA